MKKYFIYLALAAMTTLCLTACNSDDEDDKVVPVEPINLPVPSTASQAIHYELAEALIPISTTSGNIDDACALKAIDITENCKMLLEFIQKDGSLTYIFDNCTCINNVYTLNSDKVKGTITLKENPAATRANEVTLVVNIVVTFPNGETVTYGDSSAAGTPNNDLTSEQVLDYLCRTWNVDGAILDLKSQKKNIKAYEVFDSNADGYFDLRQIREEAELQEVDLSDKEKEEFERTVKTLTITRSGRLIIEYTDHENDVADWEWADDSQTTLTIKLNGEDMGNKFISDGSRITFAFNGNRCNLKLHTNVDDESNNDWEVALTLMLKY